MAAVIRQEEQNPFVADGELSRKAELIISKSTISRSEVRISDPDSSEPIKPLLTTETVTLVDEKGDYARTPEKPVELNETPEKPVELNETPEKPVELNEPPEKPVELNGASHAAQKEQTPPMIEAEVTMVTAGKGEPLKAEQVELKTKGGCCMLQ